MNTPQQVTSRYTSNLLHNGANKDFDIEHITRHANVQDGFACGFYFKVAVQHVGTTSVALGATPEQGLRRALEQHGVTFR